MKTLIFIFSLILLISCETPTINKKSELPIEVVSLKEANKYDTLLTINTEDKTYIFDNNQNYKGSMYNNNDEFIFFIFGIIIGAFVLILISGIVD